MAVMDSQALNSDPDGLAFLADVLGTSGVAQVPGRRFPIEAWTPALRVQDYVRFGTVEPDPASPERLPAHAD